jgi:light-independent protochlorophyllide reductase subunit B
MPPAAAPATAPALPAAANDPAPVLTPANVVWLAEAERELKKIPFFVRGKARRNTERFAAERGIAAITVETLYEAKAHYAR